MDYELHTHSVEVIVALPIESAKISLGGDGSGGSLEANENGTVSCSVAGGRPAPEVTLDIEGLGGDKIVDEKLVATPDEEGVYQTEKVPVLLLLVFFFFLFFFFSEEVKISRVFFGFCLVSVPNCQARRG